MNILLIEDNLNIVKGLTYSLVKENFKVTSFDTIKKSFEYINKNNNIDLIILDITLPDGNGIDLFKNIIKDKNIPTIFLTAIDEEEVIVNSLNLGVEDYITKPFSTKELIARMNKIILRNKKQNIIKVKDIKYDLDKMIVYKSDKIIELSSIELKILNLLFTNINKVVKRDFILDKIWEWTGNDVLEHTITVYMKRIREKLGSDIITTVKGIGYRIDEEQN